MNTLKFSPKDAKVIKEYPSKSPEELLAAGISKKAYEKLKAAEEKNIIMDIQPVKVETVSIAKDIKTKRSAGIVLLKNLRTGIVSRLKQSTADMLIRTYPKNYKSI